MSEVIRAVQGTRHPHYNREELAATRFSNGIIYSHAPELGNATTAAFRQTFKQQKDRKRLHGLPVKPMIPIIGQRLFAPKPAGAVAIGKASLTIYGRSSTKLLNMSRHTDGSLEPHPLHHIPIVAEEVPATASVASVDPQPPTASVHSHEGEPAAFTHTPDGEECFGTTVDAAFLASLIDYHNEPIEVQLGLDQAMSAEWQNYTEFNAVVPCTDKEVLDLMKAGHVCVPAKWVLTDRNEHLRGTPEYTPKWKARLVACGNFEHIGHEENIRADSPTAEPEGAALICSWAASLAFGSKQRT